jgi:hypothetical protein
VGLTLADRKRQERMAIDEAVTKRAGGYVDRAVTPEMSIPRLLGDELIEAGRVTVSAYYRRDRRRLDRAIRWMTKLVGGEP